MSGMGNKDDFLITTTVDGKSWHWLWDHDEPMSVDHPSDWELHRDGQGGAKFVHRKSKKEIEVRDAHLLGDHDLNIPADGHGGRDINIHFKKLHRIRPAYLADFDALKNVGPADHYASAGIREHLISFKPVEKKFHCKIEDDDFFDVQVQPAAFQITVKRAGLRFKPHGEASRILNPGAPITIPFAEMYGGAFIYGSYWWRFNKVPTPEMMDLDELDREEASQDVISLKQLGKFTVGIMAVLVGLIQAAHYMEIYQESNRKKPETAAVELKKPKLIPQIAEKPKPTPTPPPKVAEKPKPTPEPPKKVVKKEPPKKPEKKIVKKPEPKKPEPKKIVKKEPPPKPVPVKQPEPPKVVKKAPPAPPAPPAPVVKKQPVPQAPDPSVVAAQQKASVAKSLNFLSTGPSKNVNALATAPNGKMAQKYDNTGAGAIPASNSALNALAKTNTGSGPIATNSSRTVASNSGIKGGHGKGLNQVQGKVSLNALYGSGSGDALGAAVGGGMTVSGPGSLSDADIEKTLAKYLQKLQFCYEKALLSDSSLGGVIQIKWTITASGSVTGQNVVRSEMNNAGLQACLMKEFAKMQFPKPKGGEVQVKKPFKFEASAM